MQIGRIQVITGGWTGGPGLSQLHFMPTDVGGWSANDTTASLSAVRAFYGALKAVNAMAWTCDVLSTVQIIDPATGELLDEDSGPAGTQMNGWQNASFGPLAAGAIASWRTSSVVNRRRVHGRTFLSPLANTAFGGDGRLTPAAMSTIQTAATALVSDSATQLAVWHRPKPFATGGNGSAALVKSASVPVAGAVLRSRRD